MSRPLRIVLIVLAALVLAGLAGLAAWAYPNLHRTQQVVMTPATGAAAYNPLFALEHSLRGSGLQAQSQRYLAGRDATLLPIDTLVLSGDNRELAQEQADNLSRFVHAGGHLVLAAPPSSLPGRRTRSGPLLPLLGLRAAPPCEGKPRRDCGRSVRVDPGSQVVIDRPGHLRLRVGQGHVDVLDSLGFLHTGRADPTVTEPGIGRYSSDGLANPRHQQLALAVLAPNWGRGQVYLVHGQRNDRWWMRALREGTLVWVPLALALAGWLWARSQRRGPLVPSPPLARRSLREHVAASAAHLWRHGRGPTLYEDALAALNQRIARHAPALTALHGVALENALAQRVGWAPQKVALALRRPARNDKAALQQRITLLMEMRNLL